MHLLLAVDLGAHAEAVLDQAAHWASRLQGRVDLVYVNPYLASATFVEEPGLRVMLDAEWAKVRRSQREQLLQLQERLPKEHQGEVHVLDGIASDAIVGLAADGYDALLVATHGRTGLGHLFLGSVAERIVRTAPLPVIVLRLPEKG